MIFDGLHGYHVIDAVFIVWVGVRVGAEYLTEVHAAVHRAVDVLQEIRSAELVALLKLKGNLLGEKTKKNAISIKISTYKQRDAFNSDRTTQSIYAVGDDNN